MSKPTIDELLEMCRVRGIGSAHLRKALRDVCVGRLPEEHSMYVYELGRADEISATGLRAQLVYLQSALGARPLDRLIRGTGGILDAIMRNTSSSAEEISDDIGTKNDVSDVVI